MVCSKGKGGDSRESGCHHKARAEQPHPNAWAWARSNALFCSGFGNPKGKGPPPAAAKSTQPASRRSSLLAWHAARSASHSVAPHPVQPRVVDYGSLSPLCQAPAPDPRELGRRWINRGGKRKRPLLSSSLLTEGKPRRADAGCLAQRPSWARRGPRPLGFRLRCGSAPSNQPSKHVWPPGNGRGRRRGQENAREPAGQGPRPILTSRNWAARSAGVGQGAAGGYEFSRSGPLLGG